MRITMLYFASLREQVDLHREEIDLPEGINTVAGLRDFLMARGEPFSSALARGRALRFAVDQRMVSESESFAAGAEVACFPPVTGG